MVVGGPDWFIAEQVPGQVGQHAVSYNSRLVALQLGNLYLLLAFLGIGILTATTDPKVVRNYLIALLLGDVGHVGVTYLIIGHQRFMDISAWNLMTWGNVGFTV